MDANLERLRERFEADPDHTPAFEALEERYFLQGHWTPLLRLYQRRLEAPGLAAARAPGPRAQLRVRMGQILEERCGDPEAAASSYREALALDAAHRPALQALRRLLVRQEQWDQALEVAEREAALAVGPAESAAVFAEMGAIRLERLAQPEQALQHFQRALELQPHHVGALRGAAEIQARAGRTPEAVTLLERALLGLEGTERAAVHVRLAALLEAGDGPTDRVAEHYRRALTDDPGHPVALEALAERARAEGRWELFEELSQRRFSLSKGAVRRLAVAHDAGHAHLERGATAAARPWLQRALELFPDDPVVHLALADVERLEGHTEAMAAHLHRATELADDAAPVELLVESARLAHDDPGHRVEQLRRAHARRPEDAALLDELACSLAEAGRDQEWVEALERRAALAPPGEARAAAWLAVGRACEERLGDEEQALEAFGRAAEEDRAAPDVAEALGRLLRKREAWEALRDHLERAIDAARAHPERAARHQCELGELLIEHWQDLDDARTWFEHALASDPACERARRGLERIALTLGDDESILEAFEREAAVTTDRARLAFLVWELVRIFEERGDDGRALRWARQLARALPEDRRALETTARLEEALGEHAALGDTLAQLDLLLEGAARADCRRRRARSLEKLGRRDEATRAWRAALEADPRSVAGLRGLEASLLREQAWEELARIRERLLAELSGDAAVQLRRDLAALRLGPLGDPAGAIPLLEALCEHAAQGDVDAEEKLEEALERAGHPERLVERLALRTERFAGADARHLTLRRVALLLDPLERPEEAAALAWSWWREHPRDAQAADLLEGALRRSGDLSGLEALLARRAAGSAEPDRRDALELERAEILEALGRESEALAAWARVADAAGEAAQRAEAGLERLLERRGDLAALRDRLEGRLAGASGALALALHERAARLARDGLRDPESAIRHLEAAGALAPERPALWQALAQLYRETGRPRDGLRVLEAELETGPEPERARVLRARAAELALELDEEDRASRHYEALLDADPGHGQACEFLAARFEARGDPEALASVLRRRLEALGEDERAAGGDIALRLRLAGLLAGPLARSDEALAWLEQAKPRPGNLLLVAEPLADLYQRKGRVEELIALAREARDAAEAPGERAGWSLRLADALRARGRDAEAAEAYRFVQVERPEDPHAEMALRDLYRRLGEHEALARLLEARLARVAGEEEIPLRLELAQLLSEALERPGDAGVHLHRVLELDPDHAEASSLALAAAEAAGDREALRALLDRALAGRRDASGRAELLARRAELDGDPEAAAGRLREAVVLAPGQPSLQRALRRVLEKLGDTRGVLAVRELELAALPEHDALARAELCEECAALAAARLGGDASLPWLLRLHRLRPRDPAVLRRIAELHREAGRTAALVSVLEDERAVVSEPARIAAIERERAALFEAEGAPGRAVAALEAARRRLPDHPSVLADLTRLHREAGRLRPLAEVLEARAGRENDPERRRPLLREAAAARGALGEHAEAARRLFEALEGPLPTAERGELLRELGERFACGGRPDLWARAAEAELASLHPQDAVFRERRRELHFELARAWREELGQPDRAVVHLRQLLDAEGLEPDGEGAHAFERAEIALLELLRQRRDGVELERRLAARLARRPCSDPEDADAWLELAYLRAEILHRPAQAAEALEEVLVRDPQRLEAVRGLRSAAERLGRPEDVATSLERELALREDAPPAERAALLRRLGRICWRALDSTARASRAFAAALDADPHDLVSLRALESLLEAMEDWRGAADLYERELRLLEAREPERRQQLWLRVGRLARERLHDPARALRAFEAAAEVATLPLPCQREWAELHAGAENWERFAALLGAWCDAAGEQVVAEDELRVAEALEHLGRTDEALERLARAARLEPERAGIHEAMARLEQARGRPVAAAEALERAATLRTGAQAASCRLRAAEQLEPHDPALAARRLQQACEDDPGAAEAPAQLARLAARLGRHAEAEQAAERALAAAESGAELAPVTRREAALAGAQAARQLGHLETAARLFGRVLALEPEHTVALAARGEVLFALGDRRAAREDLERRLGLAPPDPQAARHLALVAEAWSDEGRVEPALEKLQAALEHEPALEAAHQLRTRLLEGEGRTAEAVDALQAWAARTPGAERRAAHLLHAAELELASPGREEPAEALLREALAVSPGCGEARVVLAELLLAGDRVAEARREAEQAIAHAQGRRLARAHAVRGRAFEREEARPQASEAWQAATRADPLFAQAAFHAARLLRGAGAWREAAATLDRFVRAVALDTPERATALHQLGRLRAGPLEDLEGAIEAYRDALAADPSHVEAREALAELLVHRPQDQEEALARHRELLEADPTRLGSLRAVLRIARGRGSEPGVAGGLCLLRALGAATAEERAEAASQLPFPVGHEPALADPLFETARRIARAAASELAESLGFGQGGSPAPPLAPEGDRMARFRSAAIAAEGELAAPALVPLDAEAAGQALRLTAQLALDADAVQGDGELVNALASSLGRRARRRVRRALGARPASALEGVDWTAWRAELHGAAGAQALRRVPIDLREALRAWLPEETAASAPVQADLRAAIAASPQARALLARLVRDWLAVV